MSPRLCMVVHGPYPVGEPRVAREAAAARAAGFVIDVVAMRRPGEPSVEEVEGAHVYRLPLTHQRGGGIAAAAREYIGFAALASLKLAVLTARCGYDVVQVHTPPDFLAVAALLPKLRGAKVVLDVHDLTSDMFVMRFGARRGARVADRVLRIMERTAARGADAVVTVHEPYRRELVARGVPPEKVTVVMNAVDESLLPPSGEARENGRFRVFYHGTVTPSYGVDLLVEAVADLAHSVPEIDLEIHGEGDALEGIHNRAAELGVADRVRAAGRYLPQREVLARAAGASVGVIPNMPNRLNRFALSSKLFEYVALGVPVVSADLPTIRAHFSDDEVVFFEAGRADALAAALSGVAADPEAARARAHRARRRYESYRWDLNAERYRALLMSLAGR